MSIALVTFSLTYLLLIIEKIPRFIVSIVGAAVIILSGVLSPSEAAGIVNWETIGLLLGMFIIIKVLEEGNFFNYLALKTMAVVNYDLKMVFIFFPFMTAFLSAFMDSITVLLFFSILTINVSKLYKINPIPLVIAEVCTANIGGSATLVGDPPNVIIGSILKFTFMDFVKNTGPIAFIATIAVVGFFYLVNKKLIKNAVKLNKEEINKLKDECSITKSRNVKIGITALSAAIFLLISHNIINGIAGTHIDPSIATLIPALGCLIFLGHEAEEIIPKIEITTLLFFVGLFVIVGGLEKTGVIEKFADYIIHMAGNNHLLLIMMLIWVCGIVSAVVDNVPLALTMSYVLLNMVNASPELADIRGDMTWALALGLDIGGNMTPIGASANVVAYNVLEKNGIKVGWSKWCRDAVPPTIIALLVVSIGIYIKAFVI